ncbi:HTH_Tnp_Tc3_2 domain-containing protein [Trichonephila clavipes]|nr:HTH_Tnp_Tc3_2 domain-containing protein [Trichonephila clavipes]
MEVSEEFGITQSVISRLWQRFQDDVNVSRFYNTDRPRVTTPNEDCYFAVTPISSRPSIPSDLSRQLFAATDTISKQTVKRHLLHISLCARWLLICAPRTATHCLQWLAWGFNILKDNWGRWKHHNRTLIGSFMARRKPRVLTLGQS